MKDPATGPRCPYCKEPLSVRARVVCARCATPHHEVCFFEHGACTVLGCGERSAIGTRRRSRLASVFAAVALALATGAAAHVAGERRRGRAEVVAAERRARRTLEALHASLAFTLRPVDCGMNHGDFGQHGWQWSIDAGAFLPSIARALGLAQPARDVLESDDYRFGLSTKQALAWHTSPRFTLSSFSETSLRPDRAHGFAPLVSIVARPRPGAPGDLRAFFIGLQGDVGVVLDED